MQSMFHTAAGERTFLHARTGTPPPLLPQFFLLVWETLQDPILILLCFAATVSGGSAEAGGPRWYTCVAACTHHPVRKHSIPPPAPAPLPAPTPPPAPPCPSHPHASLPQTAMLLRGLLYLAAGVDRAGRGNPGGAGQQQLVCGCVGLWGMGGGMSGGIAYCMASSPACQLTQLNGGPHVKAALLCACTDGWRARLARRLACRP